MVQDRAIVTVADYQQVVCSVSNGGTFIDLERPITNISPLFNAKYLRNSLRQIVRMKY